MWIIASLNLTQNTDHSNGGAKDTLILAYTTSGGLMTAVVETCEELAKNRKPELRLSEHG